MRNTFTWTATALGVFFLAVVLVPACSESDDNPLPTGSSALSPTSNPALGATSDALAQKDDDSEGGESNDEDSSDDSSDDSTSLDDDSVDGDSEDDSLDDDGSDDLGDDELGDNRSRVRDLLSTLDACPSSFTIGATVVNTTAETRFDCEPGCDGLFERLTADQFCSFLVAGLPIRARRRSRVERRLPHGRCFPLRRYRSKHPEPLRTANRRGQ